jgi:regulator of sigma E protease
MDALASTFAFLTGYILPFLVVLTIVVFVHEMGHYLVGRWCGIRVMAFSVGFGPEIFGFNDKHGTRWKLSAIPLGGYVKFFGDENAASVPDNDGYAAMSEADRRSSFQGAALWRRALTVAAGPLANFILAITIFATVFTLYGRPVSDPVVAEVQPGSAAETAGIAPGDIFVAIDGNPIETFDDVRRYVSSRPEVPITVTMQRDGVERDFTLVPAREQIEDNFGNRLEVGLIGVVTNQDTGNFRTVEMGPLEATGQAVAETGGSGFGPDGDARHPCGDPACRGAVGFHWTVEPYAGTDAGRRPSGLLCD